MPKLFFYRRDGGRSVLENACFWEGPARHQAWMMLSGCSHFRARSSRRSFGRKTILQMMTGTRVATKSRLSTGLRVPDTSLGPSGRHGSSKMPSRLAARRDQGLRPLTRRSRNTMSSFSGIFSYICLNLPKLLYYILNISKSIYYIQNTTKYI
jgi:hypothetical protein